MIAQGATLGRAKPWVPDDQGETLGVREWANRPPRSGSNTELNCTYEPGGTRVIINEPPHRALFVFSF